MLVRIFRKTNKPLNDDAIYNWLMELRENPFNPSSAFDVASIFRVGFINSTTQDSEYFYFAGVNVENAEHLVSSHAEGTALAAMTTAFGKRAQIVEGWVMGAPRALKPDSDDPLAKNPVTSCGGCRQKLAGFAEPAVKIHGIALNKARDTNTIEQLLIKPFTFRSFVPEIMNSTFEPAASPSEEDIQKKLIRNGELSDNEILAWLRELESIDYATKTGQAVVLKLSNGSYVAGVKVEEAAYSGLNALQAANSIAMAEFGDQYVINQVWTLGTNRNEVEQQKTLLSLNSLVQFETHKQISLQKRPREEISPLSGLAIQILCQFVPSTTKNIDIKMFTGNGNGSQTIKMNDAVEHFESFKRKMEEPNINTQLRAKMI